MFLNQVLNRNHELILWTIEQHQKGNILPDSYVIDVDQLLWNAKQIKEAAEKEGIHLYFMLKQLGRNPYLAKELVKLGYDGAVVVDFKECELMMKHHIPLGNVGHLVQIPASMVESVVAYGADVITVYSIAKISEIEEACKKLKKHQNILLRVVGTHDLIYPGQNAGFELSDLPAILEQLKAFSHVHPIGTTSFPCFIYDEESKQNKPSANLDTVLKGNELLRSFGFEVRQVNLPSTTCVSTISQLAAVHATHGEPGHGLSGTTPAHAAQGLVEVPSVVYVSEISHQFRNRSYCYGGGYYRRSHVQNAIVGTRMENMRQTLVETPSLDSIDYYFGLDGLFDVKASVIMSFRFQMFVTRSDVVLVKGLHSMKPCIVGIYDSLGQKK